MGGSLYNDGALNVLAFGYDTIEGGFDAVAHDDAKDVLASLKAAAQVKDQAVPWPLGGLAVEPRSLRPWSWVLTNDLYHLRISRSRKIHSGFRLLSCGLASEGWSRLLELVQSDLTSICGSVAGGWLSRVDVFADVQGWEPDLAYMSGVVCPASFRPVYPSIDNPQTFQYGKGAIVVRVYNKTAEVAAKPSHWPTVWEAAEGYDPAQDVWRIEVQLRRDVLLELRASVISSLADPMAFFAFGLEWCSLRSPDPGTLDTNPRRWPVDPVWEALLSIKGEYMPLERCRSDVSEAALTAIIPQILGLMVTAGSRANLDDLDQVACLVAGLGRDLVSKSGASFRELVAARQLRDYGEIRLR